MGAFKRFKTPSYTLFTAEAFPGTIGGSTYGLANIVSEGVGAGGSAPADNAKPSSPNAGTFWVGYTEDATAQAVNRGFRVLTENTDALDDLFRKTTPKMTSVLYTSNNISGKALTGLTVFVGDSGAAVGDVLLLTDTAGKPVYSSSGNHITITAVDNGTPGASVLGSGFVAAPTVRFSDTIPASQPSFRVWYGERTSTARIIEVDRQANWAYLLRALSAASVAADNALHGLDERYRRATQRSLSFLSEPANTAGSGAVILRDGPAPESREPASPPAVTFTNYVDKYMAQWRTSLTASRVSTTAWASVTVGGATGFAYEVLPSANDPSTYLAGSKQHAGLFGFVPRDLRATSGQFSKNATTHTYLTHINSTTAAALNPDGGSSATDRATVDLGANSWFQSSGVTAVKLGVDLLVVTPFGGASEAYIINALDGGNDSRAQLTTLAGTPADFGATTTSNVAVQWVQVGVRHGHAGLEVFSTAGLSDNVNGKAENADGIPKFYAAADTVAFGSVNGSAPEERNSALTALAWGGVSRDAGAFGMGTRRVAGRLLGDGSVEVEGRFRGASCRRRAAVTASGTSTKYWEPFGIFYAASSARGSQLELTYSGASAGTVTLNLSSSIALEAGDELTVSVHNTGGGQPTLAWVASPAGEALLYSGSDATLPTTVGSVVLYVIRFAVIGGALKGLVTRTDY